MVGAGGREHALVWKISQSPKVTKIYCTPGNAGISEQATIVSIKANDLNGLLEFALREEINLTVVGPEEPLTKGIVDLFESKGPFHFWSKPEGCRDRREQSLRKRDDEEIPYPDSLVRDLRRTIKKRWRIFVNMGAPIVVKADGLAAGKGVIVCKTVEEAIQSVDRIMVEKIFGEAGNRVVVEEYLVGEEASYIAFTDGKDDSSYGVFPRS